MNLTTLGWDGGWAQALADHEDPTLVPARVTAVHRGRYAVRGDDLDALVPAAGALEAGARAPAELPATGDWVALRGGEAIRHVLPRRTVLSRADDDAREEALAANVDLALITTSLDLDLNLRRLERFVALARTGGVEVLLVLTKGDLSRDPVGQAADVAATVGAEAIVLSARDGWGVNGLRARLEGGRTHALVGMSGVGKSTLVNLLLGEERQRTLEVRASDARGRHATTHRELFALDDGALLIDTPGLRLPRMASADGVDDAFSDVVGAAQGCRFADCRHDGEPGCG
ncbi:MAG TPA: ribosome small subunit-dependent GTPase A, partial [Solirubrobacteraceae bacterium]|nr:ribosome small subunit-dependent GTPase A [Solirubrobacteraceae bacterium]